MEDNEARLPVLDTTAGSFTPTIHVSDNNTSRLPLAELDAVGVPPTIEAGQLKLRYSGRTGIKTRLGRTLG